MSKIYICGLCNDDSNLEDLKILLDPIKYYYSGLQWVVHNPLIQNGVHKYLESIKKDGKIIYADWCFRLDFSRNHYLYQGNMKPGDWFISLDHLEILLPGFFDKWQKLKEKLELAEVDGVLLYGKRFLYKYNDYLEHKGNPHEFLINNSKTIELTNLEEYKNTTWFWGSRRTEKRDKFDYIWHFMNYYVNFPNSNHCLLGLDRYSNKEEVFQIRETIRRQFRIFCQSLDLLPLTIDRFKDLCHNRLEEMKKFINSEKIINDMYHYYILNRKFTQEDLENAHDLEKIIQVS